MGVLISRHDRKATPRGSAYGFGIALLSTLLFAGASARGQNRPAVLAGAGDIAGCEDQQGVATAALLDGIGGTVFTAGDNVYPRGTSAEFRDCYGRSWGRHRARTRPAPGNHDYESPQARPYFDYFGANAGPPGLGYYSYTLGDWHIVSLNSNTNAPSWGAGQAEWLRRDLAAHPSKCTLAYWHHPVFSSGAKRERVRTRGLFRMLYENGVALLVSGHEHFYERFAPQDSNGRADRNGVRQFVVGTGGAPLYEFGAVKTNSEARNNQTHGVLKLTLYSTSYAWEFVPVAGRTFSDRGSASCPAR